MAGGYPRARDPACPPVGVGPRSLTAGRSVGDEDDPARHARSGARIRNEERARGQARGNAWQADPCVGWVDLVTRIRSCRQGDAGANGIERVTETTWIALCGTESRVGRKLHGSMAYDVERDLIE